MKDTEDNKDIVLPFFLAWLTSIFIFILLAATTTNTLTDFETIMLLASIAIGSISYTIAFIRAYKKKLNHYIWSLVVGFILFFYVLYKMAN